MLKYNVNIKDTVDELIDIKIYSFDITDLKYGSFDKILVECYPSTVNDKCVKGERLSITIINEYENDIDNSGPIEDIQSLDVTVSSHNEETGVFSIIAPKFRSIIPTRINDTVDDKGNVFWEFIFDGGHFFNPNDKIEFDISYGDTGDKTYHIDDLEYVDCKTLLWEVQHDIKNIEYLEKVIFNVGGLLADRVNIKREQTLFNTSFNIDKANPPQIEVIRPRVKIEIPIVEKLDGNLMLQNAIDDNFVSDMTRRAIPDFQDEEKILYTPVVMNVGETEYYPMTKMNFNLHFREHSGENWTVNETDGWNFSRYGYTSNIGDSYFSYINKYESNQSDLLGYLGFTNSDVKYQNKKLQKSFLRLLFYDSPNPTNQNLMCYSTIFFNTNKLYSKFMKGQLLDDWYVNEKDDSIKFDAISTNFELNVKNSKIPTKIKTNPELTEEYRLSSQLSVMDKFSSNISSEGFYLYLWNDNFTPRPEHLYMKAEFNHAGYGRTIPMMFPYFINGVDEMPTSEYDDDKGIRSPGSRFKTNRDIIIDWKTNGYGAMRYNKYSYLRWKYKYDETAKKYIYYIDPEQYGAVEGPVVNINLYEARVNF